MTVRPFYFATLLIIVIVVSGCAKTDTVTPPPEANKLTIVTSFYPLYDAVKQIAGEKIKLINLTPSGTEPHDYEPTPQNIIDLTTADMVILNGLGLEPWEDSIIPELKKTGVATLKVSDIFSKEIIKNNSSNPDVHIWLNPVNYSKIVATITQELIKLDAKNSKEFKKNSAILTQKLQSLDALYSKSLKNCKQKTFVTGHAAFAYLARRYNLTMLPIAGLSPDSEPTPKTMAETTKIVKQKNIRYILTESLASPKIAETIAKTTGAQTLTLNPIEGLTSEEIAQGKNYIALMKDNLKSLQLALECK